MTKAKPFRKDLDKLVLSIREGKNMQQKEVAELAGISSAVYSRFERHPQECHAETLMRCMQALGLDIKDIIA